MSRILLAAVLVIGVLIGVAVVPQFLGGTASADDVCNQQLDGSGWTANLHVSEDVANGTRLVCERDGNQRTLTVDFNFDIQTAGDTKS